MKTRMLIDARHQEETRVAVVTGNRIDELDFESAEHKQIKGNIYLAKVTRVEPSLQAAFVDYGGNRHGFLAFSEIHPDYYQIPKEDRARLLAEEAEVAAEEAALREQEEAESDEPADIMKLGHAGDEDTDFIEVDSDNSIDTIDMTEGEEPDLDSDEDDDDEGDTNTVFAEDSQETSDERKGRRNRRRRGGKGGDAGGDKGADRNGAKSSEERSKASDEVRAKRMNLRRRYKIQDVIHRRQVLLVQVVKEERGNKGAALTTYLSLAGRYCVLMPNTSHGGGISRKIANTGDRKRLKSIVAEMKLPSTMGCIVRTAGMSRTKPEIKRDFDYLARLWDGVREQTLKSAAPALIHSDSDLIKRAIRDIYNRDIEDVIVEGEEGYKAAKDFMKLLMPSHAKRVQQYADPVPLYQRYGVEDQLSAMYQPIVQLKSGGYIVINPTEALVSIDINSGRSTKEHGIEATAVSTNLEAAREIARQLRLRDMAGLVVIDFIDMERSGNIRKVERAMKEALKNDRARIQVGRISSFGLMEMSRQRLRTGVLEASTRQCPHCEGTGLVRTASSAALSALRIIEEEAAAGKGTDIQLLASQEATIYLLNSKRAELAEIEGRYGVYVSVVPNGESEGAKLSVSSSGPRPEKRVSYEPLVIAEDDLDIEDDIEAEDTAEETSNGRRNHQDEERSEGEGDGEGRRKRRRRGRRGGKNRQRDDEAQDGAETAEHPDAAEGTPEPVEAKAESKGRRRGGRGKAGNIAAVEADVSVTPQAPITVESAAAEDAPKKSRGRSKAKAETVKADAVVAEIPVTDITSDETPAKKPRGRTKKATVEEAKATEAIEVKPAAKTKATTKVAAKPKATAKMDEPKAEPETADAQEKPKARTRKVAVKNTEDKPKTTRAKKTVEPAEAKEASSEADGSKKSGWWQRTFG